MDLDAVTQVLEILFFDTVMNDEELRTLQADTARYAHERAKEIAGARFVKATSVSAYQGDASLSTVGTFGYLPKGVRAFEGISTENGEYEEPGTLPEMKALDQCYDCTNECKKPPYVYNTKDKNAIKGTCTKRRMKGMPEQFKFTEV